MPEYMLYILLTASSYMLGGVPFGWLTAKAVRGVDLRSSGSGNIGATNAARVLGLKYFFPVMFLDAAKGAACALAGRFVFEDVNLAAAMGFGALAGHMFPVYLKFRGGKGVATSLGVFGSLLPVETAVAAGVFLVILGVSRFVSLSSISAALALAAAYVGLGLDDRITAQPVLSALVALVAAAVIVRHRSNIKRMVSGTEPRIGRTSNA